MTDEDFLPGVAVAHVLSRLAKAGGNEVESGKLSSPESSAALAVNTFGWFVERPDCLPPFPGLDADYPASLVDVEYCARFPWSGGRHPWLDAVVETPLRLIGIESKRFEPFRGGKSVALSKAFDRPVWSDGMAPYELLRDRLRSGELVFRFLDATQLVKHAFGLATDANRKRKTAVLVYLFSEPPLLKGRPLSSRKFEQHRVEIANFGAAVAGSAVEFVALSYGEWIASWAGRPATVLEHGRAILTRFQP